MMRYRRVRWPHHVRKFKIMSRHPYAVIVGTFAVLLILTGGIIFVSEKTNKPKSTAYIVIVSHDAVHQTVPSRQPTVGALIQKLDIQIHPGDIVEPVVTTRINSDDFRINIYRASPVAITDGTTSTYTFSAATTPRSIVQQSGIQIYPEDLVTTAPSTNFIDGGPIAETVAIKHSVPISLILYGTPTVTRSHSDTIKQLLEEKNIVLRNGDTVQPTAETPVSPNQEIFILHKGTQIVTSTETIPEPIQTISDSTLSAGTKAIRQQGSPGQLLITYQVDEKTGVKTKLQSVEVQPPVTEIVAVGTAPVTGNLGSWLAALRKCESGGNYQDNTGNGYYGAYQFSLGTWSRLGLSGLPSSAPPSVQDQAIVQNTNRSSGGIASQNPGCYYRTGISAFPTAN